MGPRAGVDGRKTSSPRDSIPDRPARSHSLYRLSYRAHLIHFKKINIKKEHLPQSNIYRYTSITLMLSIMKMFHVSRRTCPVCTCVSFLHE